MRFETQIHKNTVRKTMAHETWSNKLFNVSLKWKTQNNSGSFNKNNLRTRPFLLRNLNYLFQTQSATRYYFAFVQF